MWRIWTRLYRPESITWRYAVVCIFFCAISLIGYIAVALYGKIENWIFLAQAAFFLCVFYGVFKPTAISLEKENKKLEETERKIRASEIRAKKLAMIAETMQNGVIMTDLEGLTTWVNPYFEQVTGYKLEDMLGKKPGSILQGSRTSPGTVAAIHKAIKMRQPFIGEIFNYAKGGKGFWVEMTINPVFDEKGVPQGFVSVQTDVTERKRIERELQKAKDAAEAANEAKGLFLANISHEIRTPIGGTLGMVDLLMDTKLDGEQRSHLEAIQNGLSMLNDIVNDILDYSKLEAGKINLEQRPFKLREAIEEVLDIYGLKASEKNLEIIYFVDASIPNTFLGDVTRFKQILLNLVSNAVKFTPRGEIIIEVKGSIWATQSNGEKIWNLHILVKDTGVGIPSEKQERLFEAFTQADASTTRVYGGTGLGLAICRSLAEAMQGSIHLESTPGKGTTFTVKLTFLAKGESNKSELKGSPQKLLIVTYHLLYQKIFQQFADLYNWPCTVVGTTKEALTILDKEFFFDQIIIDRDLPDENGFDFAAAIRNRENFSSTRLILLTKSGGFKEKDRKIVDMIIGKPLRQTQLAQKLGVTAHEKIHLSEANPKKEMDFKNLNVLIVEDNPINQQVCSLQLRKMEHIVDVAENGLEAIEKIKSNLYDFVLMDCQMPEMDGYEATRRIRAWENERKSSKKLIIMALTAHAMDGERERCLQAGMDDYLTKPITAQALRKVLNLKFTKTDSEDKDAPVFEVNIVQLKEIFGDKSDIPSKLISLYKDFVNQTWEDLKNLESPVNTLDKIRKAAHQLKGTMLNFGYVATPAGLKEIEEDNQIAMDRLKVVFEKIKDDFQRETNQIIKLYPSLKF